MKLFWKKAPAKTLPRKDEIKASQPNLAHPGRGRRAAAGEGSFNQNNCAIWNDIQRALEAK